MEETNKIMMFWNNLGRNQQIGTIVGVIMLVLLLAVLFSGVLDEEYGVLFSDMEPQDAAVVLKRLDSLKVSYQLASNGRTIKVPKIDVYRTRLKLMENGVSINGGVGFELFDKDNFGTTEYAQKINYQRALQGELARTIQSFRSIKMARVHIVLKQRSLFNQKTNVATASVTITQRHNNRLNYKQVSGIQNLVSAAVPGLTAANVTVLDNNGITLSNNESEQNSTQSIIERLSKQKKVEHYLSAKAQRMLDSIYGPEKAFVTVNVELSMDYIKRKRESYSPVIDDQGAVKRKRTDNNEQSKKKDTINSRRSSEVDYLWGKTVEQIVVSPGAIKILSVAIVVPAGKDESSYEQMKEVVARAVGLDSKRGDRIELYNKAADNLALQSVKSSAEKDKQDSDSVSVLHNDQVLPGSDDGVKIEKYSATNPLNSVGGSSNTNVEPASQVTPTTASSKNASNLLQGYVNVFAVWLMRNPLLALAVFSLLIALIALLLWKVISLRTYQVVITPQKEDVNEVKDKEKVLLDIQDWINRQKHAKKAS